jgi:hypothetical protein
MENIIEFLTNILIIVGLIGVIIGIVAIIILVIYLVYSLGFDGLIKSNKKED